MTPKQPAFARWAEHGFARELVLVTPHDAPGASPGKRPVEQEWQTKTVTDEDLARWSDTPSNVGLRARYFPAIDIDVEDATVADIVERVAVDVLGGAPRRTRANTARRLLPYRLAGAPFTKAVLAFRLPDGSDARVEILADGQQYVVAGIHPTGAALEWEPAEPVASELPPMSADQRDGLLRRLRIELERAGCAVKASAPTVATENATPIPAGSRRLWSAADLDRSARRATGYAAKMPPGISGQHGHDRTLDALCRIAEVSVTVDIFDAAAETFNARSQPPWSGGEWAHKKSEAMRLHPLGERFDAAPTAVEIEADVPAEQRFTDLGNARRFVAAAHKTFRYVHAWKSWMHYDGRRWVRDGAKATHELAAQVAKGLFDLVAAATTLQDQKAISDHALRSQRRDRVEAWCRWRPRLCPISRRSLLTSTRAPTSST
jgi:hypothetical protein